MGRQSRTHFSAQVEPDVVIKMVHLGATRGQIQSYSLSLHSSNIDPNFKHVGRSWLQLQKFWKILSLCYSYAFTFQKGFLHDMFWKANIIEYLPEPWLTIIHTIFCSIIFYSTKCGLWTSCTKYPDIRIRLVDFLKKLSCKEEGRMIVEVLQRMECFHDFWAIILENVHH